MSAAKPLTTPLSSDGQLVLPKAVRERHGWEGGAQLEVVETSAGVLLRAPQQALKEPVFPQTRMEDVFGIAKKYYSGPPISIEEMKCAVREVAVERYERTLRCEEKDAAAEG